MKSITAVVVATALIAVTTTLSWAEGPFASIYDTRRSSHSTYEWTFSTSAEFITGRLGTSATSRMVYVPFTLQRNLPRGRIALTLPYAGGRNSYDIANREGRLSQINKTGNTSYINGGGLSDLILKGAYDLKKELEGDPLDLSAIARVKFPTADRDRLLGTGEADETIGVEGSRKLNDNWFVMGDLTYTNTGDLPGVKLENPFGIDLGVGYQWPEDMYISVTYEDSGALADDRPRSRDFMFNLGKPINEDTDLVGNIIWGLSQGSADFGIGIGTNIRF
jgi:hypothetical protein